ncbi:DEAD/DEAH box helicase, partial [Nostoc sp. NIES-2111]
MDWTKAQPAPADAAEPSPTPDLSDEDFRILNTLENLEARRINFGVFEAWVSAAGLAEETGLPRHVVTAALARLEAAGWGMFAEEGRVRRRMAELAREVRYLKQRFKRDDASSRPYLVRSLKLELRDRDKPERRRNPVGQCFEAVASMVQGHHAAAVRGLSATLAELWGEQACMAGFQARSLEALSLAWQGSTPNAFVVAADTGSGKTEAAGFPIIAGAAADRMAGVKGARAILAYPRIRLATNQAQRLVG